MRQPPSNTNVPPWIWDSAVREYEGYKAAHETLRGMGLDDAQADAYIDAEQELQRCLEGLDPHDEDFRHTDHASGFASAT